MFKKNKEPYRRFTDVERQISEVLEVPISDWPSLVARDYKPKLKLQTLVYMCRHSRHNQHAFGAVMRELLYRIQPLIWKNAQGMDKVTYELVSTEVTERVVELVLATVQTRRSEFCEISLSSLVEQITIKAVGRRKEQPKPAQYLRPPDDDDPAEAPVEKLPSDALDPLELILKQEEGKRSLLKPLLRAIKDDRHRKAFILRELRRWPYTSPDPSIPSLVTLFKPTSQKQIYNWIVQAKKDMRAAYDEYL